MIARLKYVSRERTGLLMYCRQIPADLREFYNGQLQRRLSLKTHDPGEASRVALRLAKEDDELWKMLRDGAPDIESANEAIRLNAADDALIRRIVRERAGPPEHRFSDALALYFKKHPGKDEKFVADVNRVFNFAKGIIGDSALSKTKRVDAGRVLDSMLAQDWKTATVRRNMAVLSAIFNVGLLEFEIDAKNPFAAQKIPDMLADAREVPSFSDDEVHKIAAAALAEKTTQALIPCLQIELGCRISEIAMLRTSDLHLNDEIPNVHIVQHLEHSRRLKTGKSSERVLPLVGVSLAAARLAVEHRTGRDGWLFKISHKLPSSRVNKWLSQTLGGNRGSHSMRHSLEMRLIRARTDQRLIDTIIGHKTGGMGSVYFSGYSLADLAGALLKIAL